MNRGLVACYGAQLAICATAVGAGVGVGGGVVPHPIRRDVQIVPMFLEILSGNVLTASLLFGVCLCTVGLGGFLLLAFEGYLFGVVAAKMPWIAFYAVPEFASFALVAAVGMHGSLCIGRGLFAAAGAPPVPLRTLAVWAVVALAGVTLAAVLEAVSIAHWFQGA